MQITPYDFMHGLAQRQTLTVFVQSATRADPAANATRDECGEEGEHQTAPERHDPPSSLTEGASALSSDSTIISLLNGYGMIFSRLSCAMASPRTRAPQTTANWTFTPLAGVSTARLWSRRATAPSRPARSWSNGVDLSCF